MKNPSHFLLAILLGLHSQARAWAADPDACPNPRGGAMRLSFSIPSFRPGGMDQICTDYILHGIEDGFTSATLTPKIAFDPSSNQILPGGALLAGELTRCLEFAWNAGLDVTYSPHVDDQAAALGDSKSGWRGYFDFKPDDAYYLAGYAEFMTWVSTHATEIQASHRHVEIILEAELETSTTRHPGDWITFTQRIRSELAELKLDGSVALGIQPNWYPAADPSFWDCGTFGDWISSLDFVAPSMYGDWSGVGQGSIQPANRVQDVLDRISRKGHFWCQVPQFRDKPFGFGEFGTGKDFQHAERYDQPKPGEIPVFVVLRRELFRNLFGWLEAHQDTSSIPAVNLWTLGLIDPIGLDRSPNTVPDAEIVKMVQDYRHWRCDL